MENIRFLLYAASIGGALLIFTAVKILLPEEKYEPPVDEIGMKLYRSIFFGKSEEAPKMPVANVVKKEVVEESPIAEKKDEQPDVVEKSNPTPSSTDESYFLKMIQDYQTTVLSKQKYRNDVVIRYYRHVSDEDRVQLLVDFGFYLHVRPVNKARYKKVNSNIIYYGHEFPERDLKLIAYLLVKNGIPIKHLQPFKDYDGWKKKSLEIGGNPKMENKPTLTFSQIQAYSVRQ